jgi:hypothetical protein
MRVLRSLGLIEELQGRFAEAEELLQQAVEGNTKALGADHLHTLESMTDLRRVWAILQAQKSTSPSTLTS